MSGKREAVNGRRALTKRELEELAEREAREILGVSADQAFALLDQGAIRDSAAASEIRMLRSLIRG